MRLFCDGFIFNEHNFIVRVTKVNKVFGLTLPSQHSRQLT